MQESALSGVRPYEVRAAKPRPQTWRYLGIAAHSLTLTSGLAFLVSVVIAGAEAAALGMAIPIVALTGASLGSLIWFGPRAQWLAGFTGLALALLIAPALGLMSIDSFFDLTPILFGFVGGVVAVIAAVAELTRRPEPGTAFRGFLTIGGGVGLAGLVTLSALSGVLTLTGKTTLTEAERAGATAVVMKDFKFEPDPMTVTAGKEVKFAVKNSDPVIHDLKIKELDLKVVVKPGSEKLFTFTAPEAGEYTIVCSLHGGMDSKLVVAAP